MNTFITGAYQTKFGELWNHSLEDLIVEAATQALKAANREMQEIQAVYIASMLSGWVSGQQHLGGLVSQVLHTHCPVISVEAACASGGVAFREAALAVSEGRYSQVLVIGAEKMTDVSGEVVAEALMSAAGLPEREAGATFPGLYALMAREYLRQFDLGREALALMSVLNHTHAALNLKAHFPFEVTVSQVLKSPLIASPLGLLDASGVSDGAAAVVVSAQPTDDSVRVLATSQASDTLELSQRHSLVELKATTFAAQAALKHAQIKIEDVGVAEVHDCFSIADLLAIEDLGLAQKGKASEFLSSGQAGLGGSCVINTSGGLKGCGHPVGATGVKQIVELTHQLQGKAGKRQVTGVKHGLAHNVGGSGATAVVSVLGK